VVRERCLRIACVACRRPGSLLHGNRLRRTNGAQRRTARVRVAPCLLAGPMSGPGSARPVWMDWSRPAMEPPRMQLRSAIAAGRSPAVKLSPVSGSAVGMRRCRACPPARDAGRVRGPRCAPRPHAQPARRHHWNGDQPRRAGNGRLTVEQRRTRPVPAGSGAGGFVVSARA